MTSKKEKADAAAAAADRIKAAALSAAKGLSRTQAEKAAAAATRNVNAYGQKEEGPSRWQERKEAKRQMYLMSTERAVILGVRKDSSKSSGARTFGGSQQCQKCFQIGHWTYECKNERVYISRPTRTQQLANPKLRPKLMDSTEVLLDSRQGLPRDFVSRKVDNDGRNKMKRNVCSVESDALADSSSVESDVESERSGGDRKRRGMSRSRKSKRRCGSLSSSTSDDDCLKRK